MPGSVPGRVGNYTLTSALKLRGDLSLLICNFLRKLLRCDQTTPSVLNATVI